MELYNIPDAFKTKLRLMIISALSTGKKTFNEIKNITRSTDGNISVQMSKLEEMGYITSEKKIAGKKTQTTYEITDLGYNSFAEYVDMLNEILSGR